jgi:hypothetical protein
LEFQRAAIVVAVDANAAIDGSRVVDPTVPDRVDGRRDLVVGRIDQQRTGQQLEVVVPAEVREGGRSRVLRAAFTTNPPESYEPRY